MQNAGYYTEKYSENHSKKLKDIISLSISNVGDTDITLENQGVKRKILPGCVFTVDSVNFPFEINFKFAFEGGSGSAIVDYIQLKKC